MRKNLMTTSASLMGRMTSTERAMGRFMRNPDEHPPAPSSPPAGDPPSNEPPASQEPVVPPAQTDDTPPANGGVDDEKARLLKDVMKHKAAAKEAADRAKLFEGIDPERARAALAAQAEAERASLEARGEYDRILEQVRAEGQTQIDAANAAADELRQQLADIQTNIERTNVRSAFANSSFVRENLVISGQKVQTLFGDHFDYVEGELVGYDKPRGESNRTPLVGADGKPLPFETALEKVVKADTEWERLAKAKIKPGAGSTSADLPATHDKPLTGTDKIRAGLQGLTRTSLNLSSIQTRR